MGLFKFNFDPDDTGFDKFVIIFSKYFPLLLFLFMNLSAWGLFKNCYQESVSHQGFVAHAAGFILSASVIVLWYGAKHDWNILLRLGLKWGIVVQIAMAVLAVFSFLSYSGFNWWFNVCQ